MNYKSDCLQHNTNKKCDHRTIFIFSLSVSPLGRSRGKKVKLKINEAPKDGREMRKAERSFKQISSSIVSTFADGIKQLNCILGTNLRFTSIGIGSIGNSSL